MHFPRVYSIITFINKRRCQLPSKMKTKVLIGLTLKDKRQNEVREIGYEKNQQKNERTNEDKIQAVRMKAKAKVGNNKRMIKIKKERTNEQTNQQRQKERKKEKVKERKK